MGLLFFPRGGSAQVTRYLSTALVDAGWSVELVTGSLGSPGGETHAPTFFAGTALQHLDYSDAARAFAAGRSAIDAPVPMHPSYEVRPGAPDAVLSAVPVGFAEHLASVWETPFRAAGADRSAVFHLHHLTPQHDAVRRLADVHAYRERGSTERRAAVDRRSRSRTRPTSTSAPPRPSAPGEPS